MDHRTWLGAGISKITMLRFVLMCGIYVMLMFVPFSAQADLPQRPPSKHEVLSQNQAFTAISIPKSKTRIVETKTKRERWSMPGWYRWLFVSNDGWHVVTGYDGMSLIPLDSPDDLVLFTFWKQGVKTGEVTLADILPDRTRLKRTASHYYWGNIQGIDDQNILRVERADGKIIFYDVRTGKPQSSPKAPEEL